jgi:prophage regulatory protein
MICLERKNASANIKLTGVIMNSHSHRPFRSMTTTVPAPRPAQIVGQVEARALAGHALGPTAHAQPDARRNTQGVAPIRLLRVTQVLALTGLSKTKIYDLQNKGDFPMRVQLSPRRVAWVEAEVQAWLEACVASSVPLIER